MAWQSQRQDFLTGRGWIKCLNCEATVNHSIIVTFTYWMSPKYKVIDGKAFKIYYTSTPGSGNIGVDVYKANALEWTELGSVTRVKYEITGLSPATMYYVRPWMYIRNGKGKLKYTVASPSEYPYPIETLARSRKQALLEIAKPSTTTPSSGSEIPEPMEFVDLTEYITAPSYDVNNVDVTEDWTDSNWTTHRIVPRTKVSGKFNMLFKDIESYNKFYHLLKLNRDIYGDGYTYLRVQINNQLDYETPGASSSDITSYKCDRIADLFFVKIDSNPWVEPYYGRFDKYNAISVSIEEA